MQVHYKTIASELKVAEKQVTATINFSKLSTNDLTNLLSGLLEREKMRKTARR